MLRRVIISRTDSIGDVALTLPLCGIIKENLPEVEIIFLGNKYTKSIIECSEAVDQFVDYSAIENLDKKAKIEKIRKLKADAVIHVFPQKDIAKLMKRAKVKHRVGTSHRLYNWLYCNSLVSFSRKNSDLHESELNLFLLEGILIEFNKYLDKDLLPYCHFKAPKLEEQIANVFLDKDKKNLIFHPKSKGSAREWSLEHYKELIESLSPEKYNIIITGTEAEGKLIKEIIDTDKYSHLKDSTGKLTLTELISLISACDLLLACSTGPLHIAALCDIKTIGIYPPIRPMHPERWKPLGEKSKILVKNKKCISCIKTPNNCKCVNSIAVETVKTEIEIACNDKTENL
ncbi:MAG: glycosyltransferase family 9 protein [Bacteroidales bacterium]|mgnify:CR=1 FL=1|jgi:ADP-heptose:LPS heptosyltransferase|nr:glycosyltransferase family 9 protein [Bacteroidales bacterium]